MIRCSERDNLNEVFADLRNDISLPVVSKISYERNEKNRNVRNSFL